MILPKPKPQDPDRSPSVAWVRYNSCGEPELVVRPSSPRHSGKSKRPRSREEILEILKSHGLR